MLFKNRKKKMAGDIISRRKASAKLTHYDILLEFMGFSDIER